MRNPLKQGRLKPPRGQAFGCGMFGVCAQDVLSPKSPPGLLKDGSRRRPDLSVDRESVSEREEDGGNLNEAAGLEEARNGSGGSWEGKRGMLLDSPLAGEGRPGADGVALKHARSGDGGAEECSDSPFHYDVLLGASTSRDSDVRFIDTLVKEVAGGHPGQAALGSLLQLAKESESYRRRMVEADLVPGLLAVFATTEVSVEGGEQGLAEGFSLLALLASEQAVRPMLASPPFLSVASYYLNMGSPGSRLDAAYMLEKVAVVEGLKEAVGSSALVMEGVVNLLRDRTHFWSYRKVVKSATKTLLALCLEKENRSRATDAGAVAALLEILPDSTAVPAERALATLELLATTEDGRRALLHHALAVPILVTMILKVSNRGSEYAAGVLCAMCATDDARAQEAAIQVGAPTQLLLLIQSDCTARARRKAMQLLKILHKRWEESPCNPDSFLARSKPVLL